MSSHLLWPFNEPPPRQPLATGAQEQQTKLKQERASDEAAQFNSSLPLITLQQQHITLQKQQTTLQKQHIAMQQQHTILQQQHNALQGQRALLEEQLTTLQQQHNTLQQQHTALQEECTTLQQQQTSLQQQHTTLQQQHTTIQQRHTTLEQQHTTLLEQHTTVQQQQQITLQQERDTLQTQSLSFKIQLESLNAKYNKIQAEGAAKLGELIKNLTPSQLNLLHSVDNFRVDAFQSNHETAQLNSSLQFMTLTINNLKTSVEKVIQHQREALEKRNQAKNNVIQTLTAASLPEIVVNGAIGPIQANIDEIGKTVDEWNAFHEAVSNLHQK